MRFSYYSIILTDEFTHNTCAGEPNIVVRSSALCTLVPQSTDYSTPYGNALSTLCICSAPAHPGFKTHSISQVLVIACNLHAIVCLVLLGGCTRVGTVFQIRLTFTTFPRTWPVIVCNCIFLVSTAQQIVCALSKDKSTSCKQRSFTLSFYTPNRILSLVSRSLWSLNSQVKSPVFKLCHPLVYYLTFSLCPVPKFLTLQDHMFLHGSLYVQYSRTFMYSTPELLQNCIHRNWILDRVPISFWSKFECTSYILSLWSRSVQKYRQTHCCLLNCKLAAAV